MALIQPYPYDNDFLSKVPFSTQSVQNGIFKFNFSLLTIIDILIVQYILTIRMSAKNIGTIKTVSHKSIGRFYRASSSIEGSSATKSFKNSLRESRKASEHISNKKRANSVGKIYTTSTAQRRQEINSGQHRKDLHDLINYEEMQKKLSNYLTCTIRTSNRQKYNYLSQHYTNNPDPQQFGKLKYCQNDIRLRPNILQLSESIHENTASHGGTPYSQSFKEQTMTKYNRPNKPQSLKARQNNQKAISNKQNIHLSEKISKIPFQREAKPSALLVNQQKKSQLSNKLIKIVENYENKNKQLSLEMKKLEKKFAPSCNKKTKQQEQREEKKEEQGPQISNSEEILSEIYSKLVEYNLKTTSLSGECDCKLDELWRSIYNQIILDDKLRIMKAFINEDNISQILNEINSKRMKKLECSSLKTHSEEYDPFLVEQLLTFLKPYSLRLTNKKSITWIAVAFIKHFQESERHWLKYLSQEKMECAIRSMILQRQISGLRQQEQPIKELSLRDFTRWLSTLYKGTLRNRNVFQIYQKVKQMSYVGRFIELLKEKTGRGSDARKIMASK